MCYTPRQLRHTMRGEGDRIGGLPERPPHILPTSAPQKHPKGAALARHKHPSPP
jgi:hypothetical protein